MFVERRQQVDALVRTIHESHLLYIPDTWKLGVAAPVGATRSELEALLAPLGFGAHPGAFRSRPWGVSVPMESRRESLRTARPLATATFRSV